MAKQKKIKVDCELCGAFTVLYSGKKELECCPFCGDSVTILADQAPLLVDFESLDEFEEEEYYNEEDDEIE